MLFSYIVRECPSPLFTLATSIYERAPGYINANLTDPTASKCTWNDVLYRSSHLKADSQIKALVKTPPWRLLILARKKPSYRFSTEIRYNHNKNNRSKFQPSWMYTNQSLLRSFTTDSLPPLAYSMASPSLRQRSPGVVRRGVTTAKLSTLALTAWGKPIPSRPKSILLTVIKSRSHIKV